MLSVYFMALLLFFCESGYFVSALFVIGDKGQEVSHPATTGQKSAI
jgi:hypothetical protein